MRGLNHVLGIMLALTLLLVLPFFLSGAYKRVFPGGVDASSSASKILAAPDGGFVILINPDMHDKVSLPQWEEFFTGGDGGIIFEDITLYAAEADEPGQELAKTFKSRLPENQMTVKLLDGTLLASKAEHKLYDALVLSDAAYEHYGAKSIEENTDALRLYFKRAQ